MLGDFLIHSGCLKYLLNSSRSCSRARESRVFTAVALKFRISEVSLSEYSSMSRRTNTIFSAGVRRWRVLMRISRSSVARYSISGFGAQSATSNWRLSLHPVQVDVVGLQSFQTGFHCLHHVLAMIARRIRIIAWRGVGVLRG